MQDELLKYIIDDTKEKFQQVKDELAEIKSELKELSEFKISMIASARTTSLIVSGACGLITMIVTIYLSKH